MKSALLIPAVAALVLAATPALACRIPSGRALAEAAMPVVGLIAVVEARIVTPLPDGGESVSLTLGVRERLAGTAPDRIQISAPVTDIVVTSCGPVALEGRDLLAAAIGSELVATGIQPDGAAPDIRRVAPLDSDRGRALIAALR